MQQTIDIDSFIGKHGSDWMDECFECHRSCEITAILEGLGHFEWQGGRIFVETGSVIMIPSELSHRFAALSAISFGVIQMEAVPVHIAELFNNITGGQQTPKIFALSRLEMEQYERIFRQWLRIMSSSLKQKGRIYAAWMEIILLFLLEHDEPEQNALTIIKAADYIRDNLHQPLRISSLAKLSGLSESAFRKLFEQTFQLPPKLYQQKCRLDEAK
jgi:AraC family transcriptional regulator